MMTRPENEKWIRKLEQQAEYGPATRRYPLGQGCHTRRELGEALVLHWDESVKRVGRRSAIEKWLLDDLGDYSASDKFLDIVGIEGSTPEQQLALFASWILPVPEARELVSDDVRKICLQAYVGVADAQLAMAHLLLDGTLPADPVKAEQLARAAAAVGVAGATQLAADIERFRQMLADAEKGDAVRQYELSQIYGEGEIVGRDTHQAFVWLQRAAEGGHPPAQFGMGEECFVGGETAQDYGQALAWYRKAAEQGNADAQYSLGWIYTYGRGIDQDLRQAAIWYREAAEQGLAEAQFILGWLLMNRLDGARDDTQTVGWYRKAAEQGLAQAQYYLGLMYAIGQDHAEAAIWFQGGRRGPRQSPMRSRRDVRQGPGRRPG
jgi:TPR repeat protein